MFKKLFYLLLCYDLLENPQRPDFTFPQSSWKSEFRFMHSPVCYRFQEKQEDWEILLNEKLDAAWFHMRINYAYSTELEQANGVFIISHILKNHQLRYVPGSQETHLQS